MKEIAQLGHPNIAQPVGVLELPGPYLLFLGDTTEPGYAKTALGLRDWASERCLGELRLSPQAVSTGLPQMTPAEAHQRGARAMVLGCAPVGGAISLHWVPLLYDALAAGLDLISGFHTKLVDMPELREAARRAGRRLIDVRTPPPNLPIATGRKRSGKRLLTVGTDCAVGKKYSALSLARAFRDRGLAADFRATGQTGIMIAGAGVPLDAVVADFAAGAAESLSPDNDPNHWDIIEGQGSLFHPAYAGVSLALLHGSQPDVLVVCHEAGRREVMGFPDFPMPDLRSVIELNVSLARRTNPAARCRAISLNTAALDEEEAKAEIRSTAKSTGLPCADLRRSFPDIDEVVAACLANATTK